MRILSLAHILYLTADVDIRKNSATSPSCRQWVSSAFWETLYSRNPTQTFRTSSCHRCITEDNNSCCSLPCHGVTAQDYGFALCEVRLLAPCLFCSPLRSFSILCDLGGLAGQLAIPTVLERHALAHSSGSLSSTARTRYSAGPRVAMTKPSLILMEFPHSMSKVGRRKKMCRSGIACRTT